MALRALVKSDAVPAAKSTVAQLYRYEITIFKIHHLYIRAYLFFIVDAIFFVLRQLALRIQRSSKDQCSRKFPEFLLSTTLIWKPALPRKLLVITLESTPI